MKKLMILGAGIYQVPLIRKAREMGLETIAVSIPGDYPGFACADRVLYLNTRDSEGILKAAQQEDIDGILTTGTDVAVRSIGKVCDAMHLTGISEEAAEILTDKARMKTAFGTSVSTSPFRVVHDEAEAQRAAAEIGWPVMMKVCDFSGSRGIRKAENAAELKEAFESSSAVSKAGHYIVEKWVSGTEIGLDAFVYGGEIVLCLPHTKYICRSGSTTIPAGHGFPFTGDAKLQASVRRELRAVADAAKLDNCAVNADLFVCEDGSISVIEAGGRAGATCIPELITIYTGIDYYKQMILCALGEQPDFTVSQQVPCIGMLLQSPVTGTIRSIDEKAIESLRSDDVSVSVDFGPGARVHTMRNGTDRIGQVIMRTDSEDKIRETMDRVISCVHFQEEEEAAE
jgi:biotin carboxylase